MRRDLTPIRGWLLALLVAAATFAGVAPTLTWPQFTGGNENIITETALEMRRGGPLWIPEMLGEPRIAKPPLVAWITALAVRPTTVQQLSSQDVAVRERAYTDLAWQVRWTGLLAGCLLILATHGLAAAIAGPRVGATAAVIVASSILFLKFTRQSTTDIHLALWVVTANACFVRAILRQRWWPWLACGAMATGIAFVCKGPVALVLTALPGAIFAGCYRRDTSSPTSTRVSKWAAVFVAGAIFLLIALPWFLHVRLIVPDVATRWAKEVTRVGATDLEPNSPVKYLLLLPYLSPWLIFLIVGLLAAWPASWTRAVVRRRRVSWRKALTTRHAMHYATLAIFVPALVMSCFRDRKDRYMLPFLGPLAAAAAWGFVRSTCPREVAGQSFIDDRPGLRTTHWIVLAVAGTTLAVLGRTSLKTIDAQPWWSAEFAVWSAAATMALVALGVVWSRRHALVAVPAVTLLLALGLQGLGVYGYAQTDKGHSPFKPLADTIHAAFPQAAVYDWIESPATLDARVFTRRVDEDLAIYLNRTVRRADPATIPPHDEGAVLILRSRAGEPDVMPPAGWMKFAQMTDGKDTWWALTRLTTRERK